MGVPGFNTWMRKKACPEAFVKRRKPFDHVYVDLASILHSVVRKASNLQQMRRLLHAELNSVLRKCRPRKTLFLAMDGPAPLAKLTTQRERRVAIIRKEEVKQPKKISTLGLTPGTPTMRTLEADVEDWVEEKLLSDNQWGHLHIELSHATVPGEGEVKLIQRLVNPFDGSNPTDSYAIIGSDSDLFIMALLQESFSDLWILPEGEVSPGSGSGMEGFTTTGLAAKWGQPSSKAGVRKAKALDSPSASLQAGLAVISILARGNDYLPGVGQLSLTSTQSRAGVWTEYLKLKQQPEWKDRSLVVRSPSQTRLDTEFLLAILNACVVTATRSSSNKWAELKPSSDPSSYLKGLEWVLQMYYTGSCPDYRFVYDRQPPTLIEVMKHLQTAQQKLDSSQEAIEEKPKVPLLGPLSPAVFLMALLPSAEGKSHAPGPLQHLTEPGSPIADVYQSCPQCMKLLAAEKAAIASYLQALEEESAAVDSSKTSADSVAAIRLNVRELRTKSQKADNARFMHHAVAHPYQRFPIERIEQAVNSVSRQEFTPEERSTLTFGVSQVYWKQHEGSCCCASCTQGRSQGQVQEDGVSNTTCRFFYDAEAGPLRRMGLAGGQLAGAAAAGVGESPTPGCRCPRCLPLSKSSDEAEEGHKVRSRTLLAQSRKSASVKVANLGKPASPGKPRLRADVKKDPQKQQKATKKAKPAPGETAKAEVKKAVEVGKQGKKGKAKTEPPPKRVSTAVQSIKAWLKGVQKDFQKPKTAGRVKGEPRKKKPVSKSRQKNPPQKTAPHHLPAEPATSASRPQWPSLAPSAMPQRPATTSVSAPRANFGGRGNAPLPWLSSQMLHSKSRMHTFAPCLGGRHQITATAAQGHSFAIHASPRLASGRRLGLPQWAAYPVQGSWHSRMSALSRQSILQSSRFRQALRHICY